MLAGLSKVQSVGEKEKSVDVKEVGIEIQKVEDESNPIPSQSKGKSSDLRSLFYLKTEPGTTVCCTKIQTTGGDRVCSRMLNAAGKCSVAGHNKIDPVHLPYPAFFVGGRGESFYIDSKACLPEAELGRVPQEDRVQLLKGQHTHAEWISQFSELRLAENAIGVLGGESVAILKRRLNFDDDEAALIKATITPSKGRSDEDVKGEDDDYVIFTNEVVQEMAVPNFVNKSGSVSTVQQRTDAHGECLEELIQCVEQVLSLAKGRTEELATKLNIVALAGYEMRRHFGSGEAFQNRTGHSTMSDGLIGCHEGMERVLEEAVSSWDTDYMDKAMETLKGESELAQHAMELAVESKFEPLQQSFDDWENHVRLVQSEVEELMSRQEKTENTSKALENGLEGVVHSLDLSMTTLRDRLLPPLMEMCEEYTSATLDARVRKLEARGPAVGLNLLGSMTQTGTTNYKGVTFGDSAAQLATVLQRLEKMEGVNAVLSQRVKDQDATIHSLKAGFAAKADPNGMEVLARRLSTLENKELETISVGGFEFRGPGDCLHFLTTETAFETTRAYVGNDMVSIIAAARHEDEVRTMTEILSRDHHAMKGGFSSILLASVYSSMQSAIPAPLGGSGGSSTDHPLPKVKSFDTWDKKDGERGVRYDLTRGIESVCRNGLSLIQSQYQMFPRAQRVFEALVFDGKSHWMFLAEFLSNRRGVCMEQNQDEKEAWEYPCRVVKGVFQELHAVRVVERTSLREVTIEDASRMMWGVLRGHQLMKDLVAHQLLGHPKMATYSLNYLFQNRLTTKSLAVVEGKVNKLQKDLNQLTTKVTNTKKKE